MLIEASMVFIEATTLLMKSLNIPFTNTILELLLTPMLYAFYSVSYSGQRPPAIALSTNPFVPTLLSNSHDIIDTKVLLTLHIYILYY